MPSSFNYEHAARKASNKNLQSLPKSQDTMQKVSGIVHRITYHNPENGWSVLKVHCRPQFPEPLTVILYQSKAFAGATMDFWGKFVNHPKFGLQFKANRALEKKPASVSALEKYLGSGLIKGVGPKTAKKIVKHFKKKTLDVFEKHIDELINVPGIAEKKLENIAKSWDEHREIRDVMIFLQEQGVSTLFATKIYKTYGKESIDVVKDNTYQLAQDIFGIGFHTADKMALSMNFEKSSVKRIKAGIAHVLLEAKNLGHCFLTDKQILEDTTKLLGLDESTLSTQIPQILTDLTEEGLIKVRAVPRHGVCYYHKNIFFDEASIAKKIITLLEQPKKLKEYEFIKKIFQQEKNTSDFRLSDEQEKSVQEIIAEPFSILTGGPGCGKTTTTKKLVDLLLKLRKKILLAAPTGRAAQRMSEVIGLEAQTIHRLLGWNPNGGAKKNAENPLLCDFLIVDECSMLDVKLTSTLLDALSLKTQVLFIGDPNQLPSVGAGNILSDIIQSEQVPSFHLTKVFRQAQESSIIRFAHEIHEGKFPEVPSPIESSKLWSQKADCLFMDSDEATTEQLKFLNKIKSLYRDKGEENIKVHKDKKAKNFFLYEDESQNLEETLKLKPEDIKRPLLSIPKKFQHASFENIPKATTFPEEFKEILKKIHPYSTLHYNMTATTAIKKLYTETIPKYYGKNAEIQILSPMIRGSLGTANLNRLIQDSVHPFSPQRPQIVVGDKIFRLGDRVIQKRNNYDLGVFNGDIGHIKQIDSANMKMVVEFALGSNRKWVEYSSENFYEMDLSYAITIHKSQGSEFDVVIIPIMTQHFTMLFRNLIYTGLTRAKKLCLFIGTRKAFFLSVKNKETSERQTALEYLLKKYKKDSQKPHIHNNEEKNV